MDIVRFGTYGRGIWDFSFQTPVGVSQTALPNHEFAKLYPNPVQDVLQIQSLEPINVSASDLQVEIYNSLGQLMLSSTLQQTEERIDLSPFSAGTYVVRIHDGEKMQTEKVLKL